MSLLTWVLVSLAWVACSSSSEAAPDGSLADEDGAPPVVDAGALGPCVELSQALPLRRLGAAAYARSWSALAGAPPERALPPDDAALDARARPFDARAVEALNANAWAAGPLVRARASCDAERACLRAELEAALPLLLRRAPREAERASWTGSFEQSADAAGDPAAAFDATLAALLQSPGFLYALELGAPTEPSAPQWPLRPEERLARLSLAFLGHGPEPSAGTDDAALAGRVRGWLGEGAWGVPRFHRRWLRTERARGADPALDEAFEAETTAFVRDVYANAPTFTTLLSAEHSFLDARTGAAYGLEVASESPTRTPLDPARLASLTTHGSWLAGRSIAGRGVLVASEMLCETIPPPPADLELTPPDELPGETARERYEAALGSDPVCVDCHASFDGYGFALGVLDRDGRLAEGPDTAGETPTLGAFAGARELAERLAAAPEARRCFVDRWATYLLGRPLDAGREVTRPEESERCALEPHMAAFAADDDLEAMLVALAVDPALHWRPARPTTDTPAPPAPTDLSGAGADLRRVEAELEAWLPALPVAERATLEQHLLAVRELLLRRGG